MNRKKKKIIILLVLLVFPILDAYFSIFFPPLKPFDSEFERFKKDFLSKLNTYKLKGYIAPPQKIIGEEDFDIAGLKEQITSVLILYHGWKVVLSTETATELERIKKEDTDKRKKMLKEGYLTVEAYQQYVEKQWYGKIISPDYYTVVKWHWKVGGRGNCIISISIVKDFEGSNVVLTDEFEFTHPSYFKLRRFFSYLSKLSLLFLLIFAGYEFNSRRTTVKISREIPYIMENIYKLADSGSFVAALNEIEKYLSVVPDDSQLIALKNKLLVKTKNNPFEAEKAFNRLKVIKSKIESRGIDMITEEDYNELKKISEMLEVENIGEMIGYIERLLQTKRLLENLNGMLLKAKSLIDDGYPENSLDYIEKVYNEFSSTQSVFNLSFDKGFQPALTSSSNISNSISDLKALAEKKISLSREKFEQAKKFLESGEIKAGYELFKEAYSINKQLLDAEKIISLMESSSKSEKMILIPYKTGKRIFIFKKDVLTLFRRDKKEPDIEINALTVSRDAHLKISLVDNKLIAEDQNSKNGTKIAGDFINNGSMREIEDGDVIDFNGVYNMVAHIFYSDHRDSSMGTRALQTAIEPVRYKSDRKVLSVVFEGSDDRIFVMLFEYVFFNITAVGISFDKNGRFVFKNEDGIVCFISDDEKTPDRVKIISPGSDFEYKGVRYKITSQVTMV